MLAAGFAAAGTPGYKHQRASQVAEGTGQSGDLQVALHEDSQALSRSWRQGNVFDPLPH